MNGRIELSLLTRSTKRSPIVLLFLPLTTGTGRLEVVFLEKLRQRLFSSKVQVTSEGEKQQFEARQRDLERRVEALRVRVQVITRKGV